MAVERNLRSHWVFLLVGRCQLGMRVAPPSFGCHHQAFPIASRLVLPLPLVAVEDPLAPPVGSYPRLAEVGRTGPRQANYFPSKFGRVDLSDAYFPGAGFEEHLPCDVLLHYLLPPLLPLLLHNYPLPYLLFQLLQICLPRLHLSLLLLYRRHYSLCLRFFLLRFLLVVCLLVLLLLLTHQCQQNARNAAFRFV